MKREKAELEEQADINIMAEILIGTIFIAIKLHINALLASLQDEFQSFADYIHMA